MGQCDPKPGDGREISGPGEKSCLFLALAAIAAVFTGLIYAALIVCYISMVTDQSYGFRPSAEEAGPYASAGPPVDPDDPDGVQGISFTQGRQAHFFRSNESAGNILIITGVVRNNYETPRSFIRLHGKLLSSGEETLTDQFVYAGNILSEDDLKALPIDEIYSQLNLKDGRQDLMNIQPGQEIPFMLVFHNLPDGIDQYRIDAAASEPAY